MLSPIITFNEIIGNNVGADLSLQSQIYRPFCSVHDTPLNLVKLIIRTPPNVSILKCLLSLNRSNN
jgi:hypothetical protein